MVKTMIYQRYKISALLLVLLLFGSLLRIYNLDRNELWADESEVVILAVNVLKYGVPMAKIEKVDNRYLTENGVYPGFGINSDDIWVYHSWGQHYITALSFLLLGKSEFSARLPFVIFGILSLIFIYLLAKILYGKETAFYSLFLGSFSIFLINYTRQARYYSLEIFSILAFFYFFINALKNNELKYWVFSSISFVFLFHANYAFSIPALISAFFYYSYENRKTFINSILDKNFLIFCFISLLLTAPWLLYAKPWEILPMKTVGKEINLNTIFYAIQALFEKIPIPFFLLGIFLISKNLRKNLFLFSWLLFYFLFPFLIGYVSLRGLLPFYLGSIILVALTLKNIRKLLSIKFGEKARYLVYLILILISFTSFFNLQFYKVSSDKNLTKLWSLNKGWSLIQFNCPINYKNYNSIQILYEPFRSEFFMYLFTISEDLYGPHRAMIDFLDKNDIKDDIIISNSAETLSLIFYTNRSIYHLSYYPQEFFLNLNKKNNIWFIHRKYWKISEKYSEIARYWTTQCEEYTLNVPDLVFSNNPDFPIYEIPKDLEKLKIYYCVRKDAPIKSLQVDF